MKWRLIYHRITFRLFVVCFLFVMGAAGVLSMLSYHYTTGEIKSTQQEFSRNMLKKEEQYLELYFMMLQSTIMSTSTMIASWSDEPQSVQAQLESYYRANNSILSNLYLIRQDLSVISGNSIAQIFYKPIPEHAAFLEQASQKPYSVIVSSPYNARFIGRTVTLYKSVIFAGEQAVIALDLNLASLEERLYETTRGSEYQIGILDGKGNVIVKPVDNTFFYVTDDQLNLTTMTGEQLVQQKSDQLTVNDGSRSLYVVKSIIPKFQWVVAVVSEGKRMNELLMQTEGHFVFLLALGLLISIVASTVVSRIIQTPVYYLIRKMNHVQNGNLNVSIVRNRKDEFGELASSFDDMLARIRELIEHVNRTERSKREMEIQALQAQMNPHFLYNTLGAISNVVDYERYEEVDRIIDSLIAILEYGLAESEKVPLHEELKNVHDYLAIQNIRYGCTFHLVEDIPADILNMEVLRMLLQPIVENSVFHGFAGGRLHGTIHIGGEHTEDGVSIHVIDNGKGMSEEKVATLLEPSPMRERHDRRRRIGLYNIHKRIQLYYGETYGLGVHSAEGKGTHVTLRFPKQ